MLPGAGGLPQVIRPVTGNRVDRQDLRPVRDRLLLVQGDEAAALQTKVEVAVGARVNQACQVAQVAQRLAVEGLTRHHAVLVAPVDLMGQDLNQDHDLLPLLGLEGVEGRQHRYGDVPPPAALASTTKHHLQERLCEWHEDQPPHNEEGGDAVHTVQHGHQVVLQGQLVVNLQLLPPPQYLERQLVPHVLAVYEVRVVDTLVIPEHDGAVIRNRLPRHLHHHVILLEHCRCCRQRVNLDHHHTRPVLRNLQVRPLCGVLHLLHLEAPTGHSPVLTQGLVLVQEVAHHLQGDDVPDVVGGGRHVLAEGHTRHLALVQVREGRTPAVPGVDGGVDLDAQQPGSSTVPHQGQAGHNPLGD
mmetsp:Transcript_37567/g.83660  ORF Transcript_37567/g.83660 Transcript_37567/m.83660 type:complete len:357 (+) Transcript_37567:640-1710(+)